MRSTLQEQLGLVRTQLRDPSGIEGDEDTYEDDRKMKGADSKGTRRKAKHHRGGFITDLQEVDGHVRTEQVDGISGDFSQQQKYAGEEEMGRDSSTSGQDSPMKVEERNPTPPQEDKPKSRQEWDGKDRRKEVKPRLSPCKVESGGATVEMELSDAERRVLFDEILRSQLSSTKKDRLHMAGQVGQIALTLVGIAAGVLAIRRGLKATTAADQ